jgi:hypothetical protein
VQSTVSRAAFAETPAEQDPSPEQVRVQTLPPQLRASWHESSPLHSTVIVSALPLTIPRHEPSPWQSTWHSVPSQRMSPTQEPGSVQSTVHLPCFGQRTPPPHPPGPHVTEQS